MSGKDRKKQISEIFKNKEELLEGTKLAFYMGVCYCTDCAKGL